MAKPRLKVPSDRLMNPSDFFAFRRSDLQAQWTCIVLAGQRPGPDRLAQHFGLEHKALVPVCGEPMIGHVVRTLHLSPHIDKVVILSQDIEHLRMVERQNMLKRFPDAQRTWLRFSDGAWSGANLFALMTQKSSFALALWADAEQDRKKAWRLFLHFGLLLAVRALTRTIGLHQAMEQAGKRLGLDAKLVPMSDPVAAIDVDKLSDHIQAEKIMTEREALGGHTAAA